jgi:hypothetical protein
MGHLLHQGSTHTLAEINALLQDKCSVGLSIAPSIDDFTFTKTPNEVGNGDGIIEHPDQSCSVYLRIGHSNGKHTTQGPAFLCLRGQGKLRLGLYCYGALYELSLANLCYVDLDPPFQKLLGSEKAVTVLHDFEKRRLEAYGYYLFLSAGHIESVQAYDSFESDLRSAFAWFAQQPSTNQSEPAAE